MTSEDQVEGGASPVVDLGRYACLGLLSNPFVVPPEEDDDPAVFSEIAAASNLLLGAILERSREDAPRPLLVRKADLPSRYALMAMGTAQYSLCNDDTLNILHAYVPLFTMRVGAARATLNITAERIVFRDIEQVLVAYVRSVLAEPDRSLDAYAALGEERLMAFVARFEAEPVLELHRVFGDEVLEHHPALAQVADLRHSNLSGDPDEGDSTAEIDSSVGESPGTPMLLAEAVTAHDDDERAVFDYLCAYAAAHLSPVVARGLRVHRDRGLAAFSEELKVTKAPRKTLGALLRLAGLRFVKTVFIYDGFESWLEIPVDMRSHLVGALSDIRWKTAGSAFPIFVLKPGEAPELEETFGASGTIDWEFPGLLPMQNEPDAFLDDVVEAWLAAATVPGATRLTLADPVLSALRDAAGGSLRRFIEMAKAAVEDAADRGVSALDDEALQAGIPSEE